MTYKCPDCGHGVNFNHQGCKMTEHHHKRIGNYDIIEFSTDGPIDFEKLKRDMDQMIANIRTTQQKED